MARILTNIFTVAIVFNLIGCVSQDLPENWAPLTTVAERSGLGGKNVVTTITPYLFVSNLEYWNKRFPAGSVDHEALRRHERQHALEQEKYIDGATGLKRSARLATWAKKYLTDKLFRWEVEKRGYKETILYKQSKGFHIYPKTYAKILSGETYQRMVSYDEALEWVLAILAR